MVYYKSNKLSMVMLMSIVVSVYPELVEGIPQISTNI